MSYRHDRHDRLNRHNRPNKHKDTPTVWADECIKKCLFCQPSSVHFQPFLVHEERRSGKIWSGLAANMTDITNMTNMTDMPSHLPFNTAGK